MAVIRRRTLISAQAKLKQALALTTTLLLTISTFAQQPAPQPESQGQGSVVEDKDTPPSLMDKAANGKDVLITIPAGTRIALVLTQPVQTRYLHRGDCHPINKATNAEISRSLAN